MFEKVKLCSRQFDESKGSILPPTVCPVPLIIELKNIKQRFGVFIEQNHSMLSRQWCQCHTSWRHE